MNHINVLTFSEIRDNFLSGQYEFNTDEYAEYGEALHNKLASMEDLVPLLTSKDRSSQTIGVYIAALEGDRACSIFSYVIDLIESPWVEIRDEVCDCFTSCGDKGEEFVKLFELLDDPEERIRVKVIQVLMWLEYEKIALVSEYLKHVSGLEGLKVGTTLLLEQMSDGLAYEKIENSILAEIKEVKIFAYVTAFKKLGNTSKLTALVKLSNEPDILKHHDIYFRDE